MPSAVEPNPKTSANPMEGLKNRLKARSPQSLEPPEESIGLRFLAQALVIVGIVATDIAAETSLWVWAIPLSLLGSWWSWRQRRSRAIGTKFLLAIGMIAALIFFFIHSFARRETNDLRLVLVELMVQIQVLHSFDLPRRKDLGYSMMIGLILLGVASTLSQTMAFGGMLLLFLAIALPVLMLDYRSRLGVKTPIKTLFANPQMVKQNAKNLALLLGVTLAIGLTVFALMPRLPGYQLRSLPMSAPIDTPQTFDNQRVTNPGYSRNGTQDGDPRLGRRRGNSPLTGEGQVDDEFYSGFGDRINQNLRGTLKPKMVMRVRSQAEGFWRVQSFDCYTGQGWELSDNDQTKTLNRTGWAYQFYLPTTGTTERTKEVVQTYSILSELPNLIPALASPRELFFPTQQVAWDSQSGMRAPVPLSEGLTYTVISEVPYRDRSELQKAKSRVLLTPASKSKAKSDKSDNQTKPIDRSNRYLQVPEKSRSLLKQEAERLLSMANSPITSDYEKALYLTQAIKQRYTLQRDLPFFAADEDLATAFLTKYKGGYPDHFSTTLAVMLRSIGISTRLTTGFLPGQFNSFTGLYEVKNTDAFALVEVYFDRYGWFAFDPIPGHSLVPPSVESDQTFTVLKQFWNWVAGWMPSPVMGVFQGLFNLLGNLLSNIVRLVSQGVLGWLTLLLLGTIAGFFLWLLWQQVRGLKRRSQLKKLPQMERLYQEMTDWFQAQGVKPQPALTPFEYIGYAQNQVPRLRSVPGYQVLDSIVHHYVEWRYGGNDKTMQVTTLERSFLRLRRSLQQQSLRKMLRLQRFL
jgi:protein-glutamine gamma-glutamyltransferase